MSEPARSTAGGGSWPAAKSPPNFDLLFEPLNPTPLPVTPPEPVTPTAATAATGAVPAWLKPEPLKNFPEVVQNQTPAGLAPKSLPGVYYPPQPQIPPPPTALFGQQFKVPPPVVPPKEPLAPAARVTPDTQPRQVTAAALPPAALKTPGTDQPVLKWGEISLSQAKPPTLKAATSNTAPVPPMTGGRLSFNLSQATPWTLALSWLYVLAGLVYGLWGGFYLYLGWTVNQVLTENNGLAFSFLKGQPLVGLWPVLLMGAGLVLAWAGLFIRDGSRAGWLLGVLTGIGVPILLVSAGGWWWEEQQTLMSHLISMSAMAKPLLPVIGPDGLKWVWWPVILGGLCGISFRAFSGHDGGGQRRLKAWMGLISFFGVVIGGSLLAWVYLTAYTTNYGYEAVRAEVDFKVFRPKVIPGGRVYKTAFMVNRGEGMLNGRNDFVQVTFDYPMAGIDKKSSSQPIILRQVDVPQNFNSEVFAASLLAGLASPAAILIQPARAEVGYALESTGSQGSLRAVTFTTPNNVLIFISSTKAQLAELVSLANNLE